MKTRRRLHKFGLIFCASLFVVSLIAYGCGGGGGGGGNGAGQTPADVSGTWDTTENVDATDCGDGVYTESGTYTVTQDGANITVADAFGNVFTGNVDGNYISWTGSYPDAGGTTTITLNLTISGNTFSGSASWTWVGNVTCSGTTQISGDRS
jgi:hypothetical protein